MDPQTVATHSKQTGEEVVAQTILPVTHELFADKSWSIREYKSVHKAHAVSTVKQNSGYESFRNTPLNPGSITFGQIAAYLPRLCRGIRLSGIVMPNLNDNTPNERFLPDSSSKKTASLREAGGSSSVYRWPSIVPCDRTIADLAHEQLTVQRSLQSH